MTSAVVGLGVSAMVAGPVLAPQGDFLAPVAHAQNLTQQAAPLPQPVGFADIVQKVKPAVISVRVKVDEGGTDNSSSQMQGDNPFEGTPFERFFKRFGMPNGPEGFRGPRRHRFVTGQGSGFFISADGYAVTNNHVVENAETVEIKTDEGKTYKAKVIGTDPRTDLALIKVNGKDFPFVKLAEKAPRIGDWVLAVGNPFGLGGTVTAGIVSARGRDIGAGPYDDFIQIDAPVNKGNSGGPAFDVSGNVIGVNTAIFSPSGGNVGIAFAIPAATVRSVVSQLKDKGVVTRGWIGVQIQPVTKDIADSLGLKKAEGALVAQPQENSPAVKAGIQAGDVIMSVDGENVTDARDLARKIGSRPPGTEVKLGIIRDGNQKTINLTLGKLPPQREARASSSNRDNSGSENTQLPQLGLRLAPASQVAGAGDAGVVVTDVDPSGVAADRGVRNGDVILEVAGKSVTQPSQVRSALQEARKDGKRTVLLRVKSSQGTRFVALPIDNA